MKNRPDTLPRLSDHLQECRLTLKGGYISVEIAGMNEPLVGALGVVGCDFLIILQDAPDGMPIGLIIPFSVIRTVALWSRERLKSIESGTSMEAMQIRGN